MIHHVGGHLHCVASELMSGRQGQHLQMNVWTLVACKADETDLTGFFGFQDSFNRSAFGENAVRIETVRCLFQDHDPT